MRARAAMMSLVPDNILAGLGHEHCHCPPSQRHRRRQQAQMRQHASIAPYPRLLVPAGLLLSRMRAASLVHMKL
jgi:hypothetical protein